MTVTVTGVVVDVTAHKDSSQWRVWSPTYRPGPNGEIITTTEQPVTVVAGVFTADLEPGPAVIRSPGGDEWNVTVPNHDANLWDVIATAVPPPLGAHPGYVFIPNGAPAPIPIGGGVLYVHDGALVYRGSSGTITTVASA
ncbi:hypothetical protein [Mycolicibacterium sp. A43C]